MLATPGVITLRTTLTILLVKLTDQSRPPLGIVQQKFFRESGFNVHQVVTNVPRAKRISTCLNLRKTRSHLGGGRRNKRWNGAVERIGDGAEQFGFGALKDAVRGD